MSIEMIEAPSPSRRPSIVNLSLYWALFFLICFSLGYPSLNRYMPEEANLSDVAKYRELVVKDFSEAKDTLWRYRVIVPYLAKPFYRIGQDRIGSWDPASFGLLAANSIFLASTALILLALTYQIANDIRPGIMAGLLLLVNFNVSNMYLLGLIDSGEIFLLTLMTWCIYFNNWWALPLLGIVGALTKDTFIPLSIATASGWFLFNWLEGQFVWKQIWSVFGLAVLSFGTLLLFRSWATDSPYWFLEDLAPTVRGSTPFIADLISTILNRNILYTFVWLLPCGILGLRFLPKGWVWGSIATVVVVFGLSAAIGVGDNIGRPLFSAAGPMLTVGAALFLWGFVGDRPRSPA